MTSSTKAPSIEELQEHILLSPVPDLEPHIRRGAFLVVHEELDLAHVAQMMAANDDQNIANFIAKGWILKASAEDMKKWKEEKAFFHFIIIQPFVLAKKFIELKSKTS